MRAILCETPGAPLSALRMAERPDPAPGPGEALVRVRAVSLNPIDWKLCLGLAPKWTGPMIVGIDGAGEVAATGPGVQGLRPGDRVAWHHDAARPGTFADLCVVPARALAPIPQGVSFEAAAALPCAGMTAYQALIRKCRIAPGESVLVEGASGGAGGYALQIAKAAGARVIALSRPANAARVAALGADAVLDYGRADLAEAVLALAPGGVDAIFQVAIHADPNRLLDALAWNGRLATIARMPDTMQVPHQAHGMSLHEIALGGAWGARHEPTLRDFPVMLGALLDMVAAGMLDPMVEHRIGLEEVPRWLLRLKDRQARGKIVATL